VLVLQSEHRVEVQRRNAAGHWELHEFGPDAEITLQSLGITISVAALYRNPLAS
jgi:Uma2 family endonuclease